MTGKFLQEYNFTRSNRLNLCIADFIAQLDKVKDDDGNGEKMIYEPMLANNTQRGKGFGVTYPTARLEIVRPRVEILPDGTQINLFFRLDIHLLWQFSAQDADGDDVNVQEQGFAFADYVWNWLTPGGPDGPTDNPNGMVTQYPGVWRWDEKDRPEDRVGRTVASLGKEITQMSGSLWVTTLSAPLRINNPLVPWPTT